MIGERKIVEPSTDLRLHSSRKLFENTEVAFALKSDLELRRAQFLFQVLAFPPLIQLATKLTQWALRVGLPISGLLRATVFDHFCGGTDEVDCINTVKKMEAFGVKSILDYSVEGKSEEDQFEDAKEHLLKVLEFIKNDPAIPFAVFKPTAFGRIELFEKKSRTNLLDLKEQQEWSQIKKRYHQVCQKANELNISLLIDAEESWMQGAADELALEMMQCYNREKAIVYNTAQMYRWDRMDYLVRLSELAIAQHFIVGIKLVRGAYLEKENKRAETLGHKSPICESKEATDENFDRALAFMFKHLDIFSIFLGTHNELSTYQLVALMTEHGMHPQDPRICFGQLYGMSDQISYNLAREGFSTFKYLPYGPVREVMPYLIRRAEENTSVGKQTSRELMLIKKEISRRKSIN